MKKNKPTPAITACLLAAFLVLPPAYAAKAPPEQGVIGVRISLDKRQVLILRAVRDIMVMSPALTIGTGEIDELLRILRLALDLTAKDVGLS